MHAYTTEEIYFALDTAGATLLDLTGAATAYSTARRELVKASLEASSEAIAEHETATDRLTMLEWSLTKLYADFRKALVTYYKGDSEAIAAAAEKRFNADKQAFNSWNRKQSVQTVVDGATVAVAIHAKWKQGKVTVTCEYVDLKEQAPEKPKAKPAATKQESKTEKPADAVADVLSTIKSMSKPDQAKILDSIFRMQTKKVQDAFIAAKLDALGKVARRKPRKHTAKAA